MVSEVVALGDKTQTFAYDIASLKWDTNWEMFNQQWDANQGREERFSYILFA